MKHWTLNDVVWDSFDASRVDPEIIPLVKAAAMVEKNGLDYAVYLKRVFKDDPDFKMATDNWAVEEVQHGDALGKWSMLADPTWNFDQSFQRYRDGYKIPLDADFSVRGSLTGELIARCMVETGTSSYYTALADATSEPVLKQICKLIGADEYRHFKLFYDHMRRYLGREKLGMFSRLKIAGGRITESEDDELAFAYHCGNEPEGAVYDHKKCIAGYMGRAMGFYQWKHIERSTGMVLKTVGLPPRGRLGTGAAKLAWTLLQRRKRTFDKVLAA